MQFSTLICVSVFAAFVEILGKNTEEKEPLIDWDQVETSLESTLEPPLELPEPLKQYAGEDGASGKTPEIKRIYGGKVAEPHSFPYQVGLLIRTSNGEHWCGGALLSDRYIVTAAHCVDRSLSILVFLGAHEIRNLNESGQKRIPVLRKDVLIHPNWTPRFLKNDIALIRLPTVVKFTDNIQPVSLPSYADALEDFEGRKAVASGWGKFSRNSKISFVLRYFRAPIISMKFCRKMFPKILQPTNICVSGAYDRSTCSGDSGGPLVVWDYFSDTHVLIGITSFGSILGCDKGFPSVFTRVSSYLDWISDNSNVFIE